MSRVGQAMLPVYERLSDVHLLEWCKGGKTQNAAESLRTVIWSVLSKNEHASLFAVQAAVSEAVMKYNSGSQKAYSEMCATLGVRLGVLAVHRAQEKDQERLKKSSKAHQTKRQRSKKTPDNKDAKYYSHGAF